MHGEVWMLTMNTAKCSARREVDGVDGGDEQTSAVAGVDVEEEEDDGVAFSSV